MAIFVSSEYLNFALYPQHRPD